MAHYYNLLYQEADAIFGLYKDEDILRVRHVTLHALAIWSPHATITAIAPDLAKSTASLHFLQNHQQIYCHDSPPNALVELGTTLGLPSTSIVGGPTYIFPDSRLEQLSNELPSCPVDSAFIVTNDCDTHQKSALFRPSVWLEGEWHSLLRSPDGPWAMAVLPSGKVICICHTPAHNQSAAEAGIWTDPNYRGQRLAAPVAATWAVAHHRQGTKIVLYSTSKENRASQSVARQLQLQPLGYIWKLVRSGQS